MRSTLPRAGSKSNRSDATRMIHDRISRISEQAVHTRLPCFFTPSDRASTHRPVKCSTTSVSSSSLAWMAYRHARPARCPSAVHAPYQDTVWLNSYSTRASRFALPRPSMDSSGAGSGSVKSKAGIWSTSSSGGERGGADGSVGKPPQWWAIRLAEPAIQCRARNSISLAQRTLRCRHGWICYGAHRPPRLGPHR